MFNLENTGSDINEKVLVYLLLNGLPKSFEKFEIAITAREKLPSLSELKTKVEEEHLRQKSAGEELAVVAPDQAWLAPNTNSRKCYNCGQAGYFACFCPVKRDGQTKHRTGFIAPDSIAL